MFQSNRREKRGWETDYPGADTNFSIRLAELTKTRVSMDGPEGGEPDHVVVRATGGGISERGSDSAVVHARGIADEPGRLMVMMIHNSDIPDGWEREAEDPEYFYLFSPDAYAVGIDIMMYAMTH